MNDNEFLLIDLKKEIENQKYKIVNSYRSQNHQFQLIDLIRCMDHSFCYVSFVLPRDHPDYKEASIFFSLISTGYNASLMSFMDDSINKEGVPIFKSSPETIHWANSTMVKLGHIGFAERSIELANQGLLKVSKTAKGFKFLVQEDNAGRELISASDFKWWQNTKPMTLDEQERLIELKPQIEKQLIENVDVWKKYFIRYDCTPELDEYYELLGKYYRTILLGSDSFPMESRFGELSFGQILKIVEALVGYALKHKDHCAALLKKSNYKVKPWDIYPLPDRLDNLAKSIAVHKNLSEKSVYDFLKYFALDESDINFHCDTPGNAPPPLIRIANDHIIRSIAGCLSNPFDYLTRSLKIIYEKDYFRAVNDREEAFKSELYDLFNSDLILKSEKNLTLKDKTGKVLTDIDAALYDKENKTIYLIQLKWLEDFGNSMKMRKSMSSNFYKSCIKWIDSIKQWMEDHTADELARRFVKKTANSHIENVELLILGRNFSHFSDQLEDERAMWCSWYRLLRILHEKPELKGDLSSLSKNIVLNSVQNEAKPNVENQILRVGKYDIELERQ